MNDNEIEKALATGDWGVDTESALARFRLRAERERVVPIVAAPRRRVATGWIRGLLEYARERGVEITTYTDYWARHSAGKEG